MRKLFSKSIFMMLLSAAVVFSFGSSGWSADKVVIKMASEYNEKHPTAVNGWMPWIQDLKNKTNGGLEIQFYNPNTLVPAAEMYNAVVNGSADMAVAASWRNFGVFPLDEVAAMPLLFNGSEAGSMTIWDLHQKYPEWQAEYKAIKPLWQHVSATLNLHTKKKEIKSVARARCSPRHSRSAATARSTRASATGSLAEPHRRRWFCSGRLQAGQERLKPEGRIQKRPSEF